jgi:hypothetical protein
MFVNDNTAAIISPGDNDLVKFIDDDGFILRARIDGIGNMYARSYRIQSDERRKKNIEPVTDALDRLMTLTPVSYEFREEDRTTVTEVGQAMAEQSPLAAEYEFKEAEDALADQNDRLAARDATSVKSQEEIKAIQFPMRHVGFVAQDVQSVFPAAVSPFSSSEDATAQGASEAEPLLSVDLAAMVGLLVAAVQEQQQEISELRRQLGQKQERSKPRRQLRQND